MSLDFSLNRTARYEDNGESFELGVFSTNITHNLNLMADACDVYKALWRPDENGFKKAKDIIVAIEQGISKLKANPEEYKKYNPKNGWGSYSIFLRELEKLLIACKENPSASIEISR